MLGQMLGHMLDHMVGHMLGHMLNHMLGHMLAKILGHRGQSSMILGKIHLNHFFLLGQNSILLEKKIFDCNGFA